MTSNPSPQACESLQAVRDNIDRIDRQLIALIAERGHFVKQAACFKTNTDEVQAPQRVEQVIAKALSRAEEFGADPRVVEAVYRAMISAFIAAELTEYNALQQGSGEG